jgi:hypothetical protein
LCDPIHPELEILIYKSSTAEPEPKADKPSVTLEQKMRNVSRHVEDDDKHLNELSKRVKASDQKIAKYDARSKVDDSEA